MVPKALTPYQKCKIYKELTQDHMQSGAKMGLLLMLVCGLRYNEVCRITFRNIQAVQGTTGCHCVLLAKFVKGSHQSVYPAKTAYHVRYAACPQYVFEFIQKRKAAIAQMIASGEVVLDPAKGHETLEDLPLVCTEDFTEQCSPRQVAAESVSLRKQVGFNKLKFYFPEAEAHINVGSVVSTAYEFRRALWTELYCLNLPKCATQYFMGDKVKDMPLWDFMDRFLYYDLHSIMVLRPMMRLDVDDDTKTIRILDYTITEEKWNEIAARNRNLLFPPYLPTYDYHNQVFQNAIDKLNKHNPA